MALDHGNVEKLIDDVRRRLLEWLLRPQGRGDVVLLNDCRGPWSQQRRTLITDGPRRNVAHSRNRVI
jgi:hypothetical protein